MASMDSRAHTWMAGPDTGLSSKTIWGVMMGVRAVMPFVPMDPADFGRCHRLLKIIPEWAGRLQEVADTFPVWAPFVREWARLSRMYATALSNGQKVAPEMYIFMKGLRSEGNINLSQ